jgi:hypothetical protein
MKNLKWLLQQFDGIWSIPLSFIMFWFVGVILTGIFGYSTGTYDLGFIQPLFLASAVVIGATNFALIGMWFTLRGLFRYLFGKKMPTGDVVNQSKLDWKQLQPIHRFIMALFVLFFFISLIVLVYLEFV